VKLVTAASSAQQLSLHSSTASQPQPKQTKSLFLTDSFLFSRAHMYLCIYIRKKARREDRSVTEGVARLQNGNKRGSKRHQQSFHSLMF
jgi:hypothetical protein